MRLAAAALVLAGLIAAGGTTRAAGPAIPAAQCPECVLGIYDDSLIARSSGAVPQGPFKDVYIGIQYGASGLGGLAGVEFSIEGLAPFVIESATYRVPPGVVIGSYPAPSDTTPGGGAGGVNIAWTSCLSGPRWLVRLRLRVTNPVPPGHRLRITRRFPPTDPSYPTPVLVQCDLPIFTTTSVTGGTYVFDGGDQSPPETQITVPVSGACVADTLVEFEWSGTDDVTPPASLQYAYRLDGGAWSAFASADSIVLDLAAGPHSFEVKARDAAGNEDPTPATTSFTVGRWDLVPSFLAVPLHIAPGEPVLLRWSDRNQGSCSIPNVRWTDEVRLCRDSVCTTFSGIYPLALRRNRSLLPGDTLITEWEGLYTAELSGTYWLRLTTDSNGAVREIFGELNNRVAARITVAPNQPPTASGFPPGAVLRVCAGVPDTLVTSFAAPEPGQTTVTTVDLGGLDSTHASVSITNGSPSTQRLVVRPTAPPGTYVLTYTATDAGFPPLVTTVRCTLEVRDCSAPGLPDLQPSQPAFTSTPVEGRGTRVTWTVTNYSSDTATPFGWRDFVYLSEHEASLGQKVAEFVHTLPLGPVGQPGGAPVAGSADVQFPPGAVGPRWITVCADGGGEITERDETNNCRRSATFVDVQARPTADLVVDSLVVENTLYPGLPFDIAWRVRNVGRAASSVPVWYDRVYLSRDQDLSWDDVLLDEFPNASSLAADSASYWQRRQDPLPGIALPRSTAPGDAWLIVRADARDALDEHGNESNVRAKMVRVNGISHGPDLEVFEFVGREHGFPGFPVWLRWKVRNNGDEAVPAARLVHRILLSPDTVVAPSADIQLGEDVQASIDLAASTDVDSVDIAVTLPLDLVPGSTHYLYVWTDARQRFEDTDPSNDQSEPRPILIHPPGYPDLVVPSVHVAAGDTSVTVGDGLPVTFEVRNEGNSHGTRPDWVDAVYLSLDDSLDGSDRLLGRVHHSGFLDAVKFSTTEGTSYRISRTWEIPGDISRSAYRVLVVTDADHAVTESDAYAEWNNAGVSSTLVHVVDPRPADLAVTVAPLAPPLASGSALQVAWRVRNLHARTPASRWTDVVSLVRTSDTSTTVLGRRRHEGALDSLASYTDSVMVRIPAGVSGDHLVTVYIDEGREVFETGVANNVGSAPVTIRLASADLRLVSVSAPDTLDAGGAVTISWQVANVDSTDRTDATSWTDRVYVSSDSVLGGGDTPLASTLRYGALAPRQSYDQEAGCTVPVEIAGVPLAGTMYLIVATDAGGEVYEHGDRDRNNSSVRRTFVRPLIVPPPNLAMSGLEFLPGAPDSLRYTVANTGPGPVPPARSAWSDRFYLSADAVLDPTADALVASHGHVGGLPYGRTLALRYPRGLQGSYTLYGITDATDVVEETHGADNRAALPVNVVLRPANLQVQVLSDLDTVAAGQPVTVRWRISNAGIGPPDRDAWQDAIHLSDDPVLDSGDPALGSRRHRGTLAPGASYEDSLAVTVPLGYSGRHYLLVAADRNDEVFESREDDNVGADPGQILLETPASDASGNLRVDAASIQMPAAPTSGDDVEFSWQVVNDAAVPVRGQWSDAVFVSSDAAWSLDDIQIGEATYRGDLPPGGRYVQKVKVSTEIFLARVQALVPGLVPGPYHVVVRADVRNNMPETSEADNEAGSPGTMAVRLLQVPVPGDAFGTVGGGGRRYYEVVLDDSLDASFAFQVTSGHDELEIFASFGAIPTRTAHAFRTVVEGRAGFVVPRSGRSGRLYLMVFGSFVPGSGNYAFDVDALGFEITAISPAEVGNGGLVSVAITGGQLQAASAVSLRRAGAGRHAAWRLDRFGTTRVLAFFDLTVAEPGSYDVVLHRAAGDSTQLRPGLVVHAGQGPRLEIDSIPAGNIRLGTTVGTPIVIRNLGDRDAFDAVLGVTVRGEVPERTRYEVLLDDGRARRGTVGERMHLHLDLLRVGEAAGFAIRVRGDTVEAIDVDVGAVRDEAQLATLGGPAARRAIAPWVQGAADSFVAEVEGLGTDLDAAALRDSFLAAWSDSLTLAPESGTIAPTIRLVDERLERALARAIAATAAPIPRQDAGITAAGIDAAHAKAAERYAQLLGRRGGGRRKTKILVLSSADPDEKVGPTGADGSEFVSPLDVLPYTIYFENQPRATAAAQRVVVVDSLSPLLDWRTFRLGEIAFGPQVIQVPANHSHFSTRVTLESGHLLDIDAGIDSRAGVARWDFSTLDPRTGRPPLDPGVGFLPTNDSTGAGQAHVAFRVRPRLDAPAGASLENEATIVFDLNEPLVTNRVVNVVRGALPDLWVSAASGSGSRLEGEPIDLQVSVANRGGSLARPFVVGFHAGPAGIAPPFAVQSVSSDLDAGGERTLGSVWMPARVLGPADVTVQVDADSAVLESDESNNFERLTFEILPRTFTVQVERGINIVALPLDAALPVHARAFAARIGARLLVQCDSTDVFAAFAPAEQSQDGFAISGHRAYVAIVDTTRSVEFSGMTLLGSARYAAGLGTVALPLQSDGSLSARRFAALLGATQLIRYSPERRRFEIFEPDSLPAGEPGYSIRGGEGYFARWAAGRTVLFEGKGWLGIQPPQADWEQPVRAVTAGAAVPAAVVEPRPPRTGKRQDSTPLFAVIGSIVEERWGERIPVPGGFRVQVENLNSGSNSEVDADGATAEYSTAFLDFTGQQVTRLGDTFRVQAVDPLGGGAVWTAEHAVTAADLGRYYARVDVVVSLAPRATVLHQNFPNPFNPGTKIRYQLAVPGNVSLRIYDVRGRLVRTLQDGHLDPGYYESAWDGRDGGQTKAASGVYFYELRAPDLGQSRKMVLLH